MQVIKIHVLFLRCYTLNLWYMICNQFLDDALCEIVLNMHYFANSEHCAFCCRVRVTNIESESQVRVRRVECGSESESLLIMTRVRVRVTKNVTRVRLESESRVTQV